MLDARLFEHLLANSVTEHCHFCRKLLEMPQSLSDLLQFGVHVFSDFPIYR